MSYYPGQLIDSTPFQVSVPVSFSAISTLCLLLLLMSSSGAVLWGLPAWARILSLALQTTDLRPTQLSILPRSVNEYSEATLRAQTVVPEALISRLAAHIPSLR